MSNPDESFEVSSSSYLSTSSKCDNRELENQASVDSLRVDEETGAERSYYEHLINMEEDLSDEEKAYCLKTLREIGEIRREMDKLYLRLEKFDGTKKDREYVFLDESMIRCTLKLDNLDMKGIECLRKERKRVVMNIQNCMRYLDSITKRNEQDEEENLGIKSNKIPG